MKHILRHHKTFPFALSVLQSEESDHLTTWTTDNIFQKSVLWCHQSSFSPVHSAAGQRRSGLRTCWKLDVKVMQAGWESIGGMEKIMVTLRRAWLLWVLCTTERSQFCRLRAPLVCACALANCNNKNWLAQTGISSAMPGAMEVVTCNRWCLLLAN